MALPREPRQKMINIMYLVLTAILALNVSAEILEAFKTVDKSLINSSKNIEAGNRRIYYKSFDLINYLIPIQIKNLPQTWHANATE